MAVYIPPAALSEKAQTGDRVAGDLIQTLTRIHSRVEADLAMKAEQRAALAWCHANGNPHLKDHPNDT